jgi:hypothetical protein
VTRAVALSAQPRLTAKVRRRSAMLAAGRLAHPRSAIREAPAARPRSAMLAGGPQVPHQRRGRGKIMKMIFTAFALLASVTAANGQGIPPPGPLPLGWVYGPYTMCGDPPRCSTGIVNVPADGLNVRAIPNGQPLMSLVNGTPLIPLGKEGDWLLVAAGCDLTPTFAWSWTAGVPLNRCWVYF